MRTYGIQFGRRWAIAFVGVAFAAAACTSSGGGAGVYGGGATSAPAASPPPASQAAASTAPSAAAGGGKYSTGNEDDYGTPASKPPASAGAAGATAIGVGNGAVGAFLTGAEGMTLYIFKKDSAGKSACEADCATNWPPLVVAGGAVPAAGDGVTGALTTFARPDGAMQVAYNGAPLYYFAGDSAVGDTNGQGVGGNWFVATP